MIHPVADVRNGVVKLTQFLRKHGAEIARDPATVRDIALNRIDIAVELRKIALVESDSPTRFKGPLGGAKCAAWADPLPLKTIGNALGCSVNDVLLATVAGALRDYLAAQGDVTEGVERLAVVPFNLRRDHEATNLGNQFGLVFVELPVGVEDPLQRLRLVKERMQELKGSYKPITAFLLLNAVGLGPKNTSGPGGQAH